VAGPFEGVDRLLDRPVIGADNEDRAGHDLRVCLAASIAGFTAPLGLDRGLGHDPDSAARATRVALRTANGCPTSDN
jgi:hypothetical protein